MIIITDFAHIGFKVLSCMCTLEIAPVPLFINSEKCFKKLRITFEFSLTLKYFILIHVIFTNDDVVAVKLTTNE